MLHCLSTNTTSSTNNNVTNNNVTTRRGSEPEERLWVGHAKKMSLATSNNNNNSSDRFVLKESITTTTQKAAAECLCATASNVVIHLISILIEICPLLVPSPLTTSNNNNESIENAFTFILRDSNIDESMLVGIENLPLVYFKRMLISVILHGLYCNQQDLGINNIIIYILKYC